MSAYITQRLKTAWELFRQRKLDEAEEIVAKLLKSQPDHCDANNLMAGIQLYKKYVYRAIAYAQAAIRSSPTNIPARQTMVSVLTAAGDRRGALGQIQKLIEMNAEDSELAIQHAGTLRDLWRYDDSVALYHKAIAKYPDNELLPSLLPFTMQYAPRATRREIFEAHAALGKAIERRVPPVTRKHRNSRDPDRLLRVGVISADFYGHSVMFFFEPILEHADPSRVRFWAYQTRNPGSDSTTARLRTRFAGWREVYGETPGKIAEKILADEIDVVLDLNGLTTTLKGLEVLNHAPAPVTITYCGYPDTTGCRAVHYRFVDSITDPPGSDEFAVEELVRLDPCFLCYTPQRDAPPFNPQPPSARNGYVTFGSFNNLQKLNEGVIAAWSLIVNAVPGSRLFLKDFRMREPSLKKELLALFDAAGLPEDRLELYERAKEVAEHLTLYDRIDVALDPFPYNGTTTTCEAAYQGVPTVTLRGERHATRVGASLFTNIGVPELITASVDEYVARAVELAGDPARLAGLRASLRDRMIASPLCDAGAFAGRFEAAVRALWNRWCDRAE